MSNVRSILFFLVGILLTGGFLVWSGMQSRRSVLASAEASSVLCAVNPKLVDACSVQIGDKDVIRLVRTVDGAWNITNPFEIAADASAVMRLLDALTLVSVTDMRSEGELHEMGETLDDFGIDRMSLRVMLQAGSRIFGVAFGRVSPSGGEVYAHVEETRRVCVLPYSAFALIPRSLDEFRERGVLTCPRDEIAGLDIRMPDKPALRLVRDGGTWSIHSPAVAPADGAAVGSLVDRLVSARVAAFEIPSAARPTVPSGGFKAEDLVPYGLDAGLSVIVRGAVGTSEQVVFGRSAGTNLVWALIRNGTSVVKLESELAERCRASGESLRDTRVFPLADGETVRSLSIMAGASVYVLARGTNGIWRIEAPVVAPADQGKAAAFAEKLLKLRQNDVSDGEKAGDDRVVVSVSTSVTNRPGLAVSPTLLGGKAAFADLRSKTLLVLDPSSVRRLSVSGGAGSVTAVRWNAERRAWDVVRDTDAPTVRRVADAAVKGVLSALARLEAAGVETLAATAEDMRRCGLDKPSFVLAADVESADAMRYNVLLGGNAPGGGRYATVGGADAVFVLSRRTVADLTAPLAE